MFHSSQVSQAAIQSQLVWPGPLQLALAIQRSQTHKQGHAFSRLKLDGNLKLPQSCKQTLTELACATVILVASYQVSGLPITITLV